MLRAFYPAHHCKFASIWFIFFSLGASFQYRVTWPWPLAEKMLNFLWSKVCHRCSIVANRRLVVVIFSAHLIYFLATGAMRLPVRFNIGNFNAVLEVLIEAFQMITITMQILPQPSASAAYSLSSQYETAASYLRLPDVDWWTLYWKLALVIAFSLLSSLIFVEVNIVVV